MRVLVLGGYGLIGLEISKRLFRAGHTVVGLGRSRQQGRDQRQMLRANRTLRDLQQGYRLFEH